MEDEDVWFRDSLADFVEEKFLLQTGREKFYQDTHIHTHTHTHTHRLSIICIINIFPHRVHQCRLCVSYQNEDVGVQTELIDPAVQLQSDISARADQKSEVTGRKKK